MHYILHCNSVQYIRYINSNIFVRISLGRIVTSTMYTTNVFFSLFIRLLSGSFQFLRTIFYRNLLGERIQLFYMSFNRFKYIRKPIFHSERVNQHSLTHQTFEENKKC